MMLFLSWSLKISAILGFSLIAIRVLRRQSAALRHWVLSAAMLCAALIPALSVLVPALDVKLKTPIRSFIEDPATEPSPATSMNVSVAPGTAAPASIVSSKATSPPKESPATVSRATVDDLNRARLPAIDVATSSALPESRSRPHLPEQPINLEKLLKSIWLVGVTLGFAGLIGGVTRLAWIASRSDRLLDARWTAICAKISSDYRLSRPLRLLRTRRPSLLATWGVFLPEVLLPSGAMDWPEERIDVVLSHELAHIQRRDWVIQILSQMVRAFYWFNPLVWIVCNRLNQESEQASDDVVLNRGVAGADYAAHLLSLARTLNRSARVWTPALMMARESTFKRRFRAMLNPRLNRSALTRIPFLATVVVLLAITLPVVALRVSGQRAPSLVHAVQQITAGQTALIALIPQISSTQPLIPGVPGIQGTVVGWGTNDPVSDVDVELIRVEGTSAHPLGPLVYPPGLFSPGGRVQQSYPNPSDISHARTRGDGKFRFTNLFSGKYKLWAVRAGSAYYTAEYGQRDPRGPGMLFQFADGQVINDLKLPMAANGTISGIVFDADGMPAAHVRVMAFEATFNAGRRLFQLTEGTETDDRGAYRLFFLPPGKYTIAARPEDPRRRYAALASPLSASLSVSVETHAEAPISFRVLDSGNVIEETYTLAYYGGGTDPQNARLIDLKPGANVESIDLPLRAARMRAVHIRGIVTDSTTGKPASGASISAVPAVWSPSLIVPSVSSDSNGYFDIPGVGSGPYTLVANLRANGMTQNAVTGIDVNEKDIDGVGLFVSSGTTISGHISIEGIPAGGSPPDISAMAIVLSPGHPNLPGASSRTIQDGGFTINGVQPGTYRIFINPVFANPGFPAYTLVQKVPAAMQGVYVKSIHLGAEDALNGSVHVENSPPREIAVVLGMNGGSIEGTAFDSRQQKESNAVVALVPDSQSLRNRTDLYKSAVTDVDGKFSIQGIAPGTYKLFSWDYADNGAWFDADFLGASESRGKTISIVAGKNPSVDLTIIGAPQ